MLTLLCGKMGAGKSTKAREISESTKAVLFSEDVWLETLYPGKIQTLQDYMKHADLLKPLVRPLVQSILNAGTSVVMDFPANTISQRKWLKSIYSEIKVKHELLYIDVSDDVCLRQITKRRQEHPDRATTDTEQMFHQVTKYFVKPSHSEGFNIIHIK